MNSKSNKTQLPVIHILLWVLVFGLPFLIFTRDSDNVGIHRYTGYAGRSLLFMLIFYANYIYLIDKFFFTKRIVWFIIINIALIAFCCLLQAGFDHINFRYFVPHDKIRKLPRFPGKFKVFYSNFKFFGDSLSFALITGLSMAVKVSRRWYSDIEKYRELKNVQTEAELKNLKSQLNPHFLFNTLNNIYSLVSIDQNKAQEAIHKLSKLLRYTLYDDNKQRVPLEKELEFVNNYIELMKLRLTPNTELNVNISGGKGDETIAPLIFITIIENAFKHGIGNQKSFINITINVENGKANCMVENSCFTNDIHTDQSGSGIGLENISRRLALLYPDKHNLQISKTDSIFTVNLQIDLH